MSAKTHRVACDLIDPPNNACKLKPEKVKRLAKSIRENDLLQPPGVIQDGQRFRIVYGFHRLKAIELLGRKEIEVRVLPSDTTAEAELTISIQENHIREPEDYEDTLARIEQVAIAKSCSIAKAAADVGVSGSYASKARQISKRLSPEAKEIAKTKRAGISILYALSRAPSDQQAQLLNSYLAGSLTRDEITQASKKKSSRTAKQTTLSVVIDELGIKFTMPASTSYEQLLNVLATLKSQFSIQRKNKIPVKLLPEVMKEVPNVV